MPVDYITQFQEFVLAKRRAGVLTVDELIAATKAMTDIIEAAGDPEGLSNSPAATIIIRHGIHAAKQELLRFHPEFKAELDRLDDRDISR